MKYAMRISRTVEVAIGHRLRFHEGKCRNYHGHNYQVTVEVNGPVDDRTGMVMDYSELKAHMRAVLDPYDHAMVVHEDDPFVVFALGQYPSPKCVTVRFEPTAENLAKWWRAMLIETLGSSSPLLVTVRVRETSDTEACSL